MTTLTTIRSTVRGGGFGSSAWVAKITGTDPKYGLKREFVRREDCTSRSGRSGTIYFEIEEPGIYEVRGVQLPKGEATIGSLWSAFIEVDAEGNFQEISKAKAAEAAAQMDAEMNSKMAL